jgi:hypothetical protein
MTTRPAMLILWLHHDLRSYKGTGRGRLMFECVDEDQESLPGSTDADFSGGLLHHVEAECGINCVV